MGDADIIGKFCALLERKPGQMDDNSAIPTTNSMGPEALSSSTSLRNIAVMVTGAASAIVIFVTLKGLDLSELLFHWASCGFAFGVTLIVSRTVTDFRYRATMNRPLMAGIGGVLILLAAACQFIELLYGDLGFVVVVLVQTGPGLMFAALGLFMRRPWGVMWMGFVAALYLGTAVGRVLIVLVGVATGLAPPDEYEGFVIGQLFVSTLIDGSIGGFLLLFALNRKIQRECQLHLGGPTDKIAQHAHFSRFEEVRRLLANHTSFTEYERQKLLLTAIANRNQEFLRILIGTFGAHPELADSRWNDQPSADELAKLVAIPELIQMIDEWRSSAPQTSNDGLESPSASEP